MFTTAGLMRCTTSAKLATAEPKPAPSGRDRAAGTFAVPAIMDVGPTPPATIAPTRNDTTAVSASVIRVNRRDIGI